MIRAVYLALLALAPAFGQTFEVAAVKPSAPDAQGTSIQFSPGGRLTTTNTSLRTLITFAWNLRNHQLTGGPGWLGTDGFDIVAKPAVEIPDSEAGHEQMKLMVRALLAERFHLTVHSETKELPIYALVVAKSGSKLAVAKGNVRQRGIRGSQGGMTCTEVPMGMLADQLGVRLGRTVVDKTGLTGTFDFKLEWQPDAGEVGGAETAARTGPSLFTAVQEQLGLKLEPGKGPVEILVVDHAEKPAEN